MHTHPQLDCSWNQARNEETETRAITFIGCANPNWKSTNEDDEISAFFFVDEGNNCLRGNHWYWEPWDDKALFFQPRMQNFSCFRRERKIEKFSNELKMISWGGRRRGRDCAEAFPVHRIIQRECFGVLSKHTLPKSLFFPCSSLLIGLFSLFFTGLNSSIMQNTFYAREKIYRTFAIFFTPRAKNGEIIFVHVTEPLS